MFWGENPWKPEESHIFFIFPRTEALGVESNDQESKLLLAFQKFNMIELYIFQIFNFHDDNNW